MLAPATVAGAKAIAIINVVAVNNALIAVSLLNLTWAADYSSRLSRLLQWFGSIRQCVRP
jgi:hypothetical protein